MAFSLMNGLSTMGAAVADYAGKAGLEAQRADLAQQQLTLADQLATVRESTGRKESGEIAATAAAKAQDFTGSENEKNRQATTSNLQISEAGANSRNAASVGAQYAQIAAGEPGRAQEILASRAKVALETVQTQNATDLRTAHQALQEETGKPNADPAKIATLKSQVTSLETSAATEAATTTAAAAMYKTDYDAVQHFNTQLGLATTHLNTPDMNDTDRAALKAHIASLRTQLNGAQRSLEYSSNLVHARVGAQTGTALPTTATGNRPPLSSFGGRNQSAGPRVVQPPSVMPGFVNGAFQ
jgi:hypothetical protein